MNPGQIYAIKIPSNPYLSMRPVPFSMYGSPCKNKCMKIKKNLKPKTEMDHDYLVDIMNMLDGSMDMPNVRVRSNMFQPTLISAFKIKSKGKGKKKYNFLPTRAGEPAKSTANINKIKKNVKLEAC